MSKKQAEINKEIAAFITAKDLEGSKYSAKDKQFISQYSGSGGLGVDDNPDAVLYEFYTPDFLAKRITELVKAHGFNGGNVLEPSCGTGVFLKHLPNSKVVGFEVNKVTFRIAQILYPKATIYNDYFETAFLQQPRKRSVVKGQKPTWLKEYPFDLVIGNPPYGIYRNLYSSYFNSLKIKQIEQFFIYQGLRLLKKGGLLAYLISSNFLSNGVSYNAFKQKLDKMCVLLDAYRLPSLVGRTGVPVDILILKRV